MAQKIITGAILRQKNSALSSARNAPQFLYRVGKTNGSSGAGEREALFLGASRIAEVAVGQLARTAPARGVNTKGVKMGKCTHKSF